MKRNEMKENKSLLYIALGRKKLPEYVKSALVRPVSGYHIFMALESLI